MKPGPVKPDSESELHKFSRNCHGCILFKGLYIMCELVGELVSGGKQAAGKAAEKGSINHKIPGSYESQVRSLDSMHG